MRKAFLAGTFALAFVATVGFGGLSGQDPKTDPKGKEAKADPKGKDTKPEGKTKGQLPQNWGALGLTAEQKDKVYKLQAKYNADIDKLEAEIKELKAKLGKERLEILTAEQKKALEDILKKKAGGGQ